MGVISSFPYQLIDADSSEENHDKDDKAGDPPNKTQFLLYRYQHYDCNQEDRRDLIPDPQLL